MLKSYRTHYAYKDVSIKPAIISNIEHRSECVPYDDNGMLPLFTAPMDTVVNEANFNDFLNESIYAILPRTVDINKRLKNSTEGKWSAYSLDEFERLFCNNDNKIDSRYPIHALIDVANGHMAKILKVSKEAKKNYGSENIIIMAGNIANPSTYTQYAEAGIDYCRCGIGGGNCCITATQLGVFYPMASLIHDVQSTRQMLEVNGHTKLPKIIADGGIRNYDDIIKALALGADYVMCGSVFARMMESAAKKFIMKDKVDMPLKLENRYKNLKCDSRGIWSGDYTQEFIDWMNDNGVRKQNAETSNVVIGKVSCKYYGMASAQGQIALSGSKFKTSEGNMKMLDVKYTMHSWCTNFKDYLRSAMSYIDCKTIGGIPFKADVIINSLNASNSINK